MDHLLPMIIMIFFRHHLPFTLAVGGLSVWPLSPFSNSTWDWSNKFFFSYFLTSVGCHRLTWLFGCPDLLCHHRQRSSDSFWRRRAQWSEQWGSKCVCTELRQFISECELTDWRSLETRLGTFGRWVHLSLPLRTLSSLSLSCSVP